MPLLMAGLTVQGSVVYPRNTHQRMLAFAARHNIRPQTQTFRMDKAGIVEAFGELAANEMGYQGVLIVPEESTLVA